MRNVASPSSEVPRNDRVARVLPLRRRPLDVVLAGFFVVSIVYGFAFSLPEGLGVPVAPDSPWPPLRALHGWAVEQEPAHLEPPPSLVASLLFDGFVQSPFLLVLVHALLRGREWIRVPALVYAGAATMNMYVYFFQTVYGPHPPPHPAVYWPLNLPWLVAPMVLAWRMRRAPAFARPID
jgi:hypothetical protein